MITNERLGFIWDELEEAILYGDESTICKSYINKDEFREQQQIIDDLRASRHTIRQQRELIDKLADGLKNLLLNEHDGDADWVTGNVAMIAYKVWQQKEQK